MFLLLLGFWFLGLGMVNPAQASDSSSQCSLMDWEHIPPNVWVKLPTCGPIPRKVFHGAATLMPETGEVLFFGADTHEIDYDNSVTRLNLNNLTWTRDYEADPLKTYGLTSEGYPVTKTGKPWAMHAFDTWDYHPPTQTVVLVGFPKHAHKAKQALHQQGLDPQKLKPATWLYYPNSKKWELLKIWSPNLFAFGLVWNPDANEMIGHNGSWTYHLNLDPGRQTWKTYPAASTPGWSLRLVYDTFRHQIFSLGNSNNSQDLWAYSPIEKQWEKVPVDHPPLPAHGAAMAYNTRHQVLVYLANDDKNPYSNPSGKSATFLFFTVTQRWKRLTVASPPLFGMNYLTQYDPIRNIILHFEKTSVSDDSLAVWAFKVSK